MRGEGLLVEDLESLRQHVELAKRAGHKIALVPTMGNLHCGHLELVRKAKQIADYCITSIYLNPMQFGPQEDFDSYPRTLASDLSKLQSEKCDMVFTPSNKLIYPNGPQRHSKVYVPEISHIMCGASRPGFFEGITTVVTILLNMVAPDIVVFGLKDFQQTVIIKKVVEDLSVNVKIVTVDTVRDEHGLALSSRNQYLDENERKNAIALYQALCTAKATVEKEDTDFSIICEQGVFTLRAAGFEPDYFEIRNQFDLSHATNKHNKLVVAAAGWLGNRRTRLIDNILID